MVPFLRRPSAFGLMILAGSAALGQGACTTFPTLDAFTCGNGVVEPGEDCDSFPRGEGTACRAPGGLGACRLDCSPGPDGTRARCPAGWGCGTDGLCRSPAGIVQREGEPIPADAWRVTLGDFDGDGRKDVVARGMVDASGASKLRVHFFDGAGRLATTRVLPVPASTPLAVDLSGDGRDDLVFSLASLGGGVGVLTGQEDGTFVPVPYPSFVFPSASARIVPVGGLTGTDTAFAMFARVKGEGGREFVGFVRSGDDERTLPELVPTTQGPESLAEDVLQGDFAEATPCQEVVLGFKAAPKVTVYEPCVETATGVTWNARAGIGAAEVSMPSGFVVASGPRAADVDGDGHLDLLVGVVRADSAGDVPQAVVAYGNGAMAFRSEPGGQGLANQTSVLRLDIDRGDGLAESSTVELPLAAADLNADGRTDYVFPYGIAVSTTGIHGPLLDFVTYKTRGTWSTAAIADVNADGRVDVLAASATELDVDYFNGTDKGLSPFSIPTTGPVTRLVVGDVDGDSVGDLIVAQSLTYSDTGDEVAIAFGQPFRPPAVPVSVGRFQRIQQLVLFDTGTSALGIGLSSAPLDPKAAPETSITAMRGNADRQPLAPYNLQVIDRTVRRAVPFSLGVGAFSKAGARELLAVAGEATARDREVFAPWLLTTRVDVPTEFEHVVAGEQFGPQARPVSVLRKEVATLQTSADVDGDGRTEGIVLAPWNDQEIKAALYVLRVTDDGQGLLEGTPVVLEKAITQRGQLEAEDLNGDGAPDLVLLTGGDDGPRELMILWNDGHGAFVKEAVTRVTLENETPQGFTLARLHEGGTRSLVYVTGREVRVAELDVAARTLRETRTLEGAGALRYGTGIAAGDVDGDGVDDLVVADAGSLLLLRGKAVLP